MADEQKPRGNYLLVSQMTQYQAEQKRTSDRLHKRYSRARKNNNIQELQAKNTELVAKLKDTERKLKKLQESHDALRNTINALHAVANTDYPAQDDLRNEGGFAMDPQTLCSSETPLPPNGQLLPFSKTTASTSNQAVSSDLCLEHSIEFGSGMIGGLFNENLIGSAAAFSLLPNVCHSWQANPITESEQENEQFPSLSKQLLPWQRLPLHLAPITAIDHVLVDIPEVGRQWSRQKGQPYEELSRKSFPSIASLLNPTTDEAISSPVSTAVGQHATFGTSVLLFPSRVAYHYIVAHLVRWYLCRNEESYNQLPEFLKPTELQLTVPHPPWVDTFACPKARDLLITHMDWTQYELLCRVTCDYEINWPGRDSDMFVTGLSKHHLQLSPAFVAHIRNNENWTFGPAVAKHFPFMKDCPRVIVV